MAKPKLDFALVCDDVRQEIGNKLSYIGVYGSSPTIFVSKVPSVFPKLCFVLAFKNLRKGATFSIRVEDPAGKKIGEIKNGIVPQSAGKKITLFGVFSPLNVKKEGAYTVLVTFDDDDKTAQEIVFNIKQSSKPKK